MCCSACPGRLARISLAGLFLLVLLPTLSSAAPFRQGTRPKVSAPFPLAAGPGSQKQPAMMGNVMVYTVCRPDNCDVWGMDLVTRKGSPISEGDWDEQQPATDGVRVLWRDSRNSGGKDPDNKLNNFDIYGTYLEERKTFPVSRAPSMQNRPDVWGNTAVWSDFRDAEGPHDGEAGNVYRYNIPGGKDAAVVSARSAQSRAVTNGRFVVWVDYRNEPDPAGNNADIYALDLSTNQEFAVTTAPDTQTDPAISGNLVVWADWRKGSADIYGYDLIARREFVISAAPGSQVQPAISSNLVAWVDFRNEKDAAKGTNADIYAYDLGGKQEFPVFVGPGPQASPSVSGGTIAWEDQTNGISDYDIVGATVSGLNLVAPPTPPPYLPGNGARAFPETKQEVTGIFLDYWQKNGGIPQQGYPISSVMREVSDLDGKPYTMQYMERAVFEYHPENKPPFNVLLAQLGTFRYNRKYPTGTPFAIPNNGPGSIFFPQTGKWLGGGFLQYWQRNGGLPQQGYPVSDEFTEKSDADGKEYRVQYFERAVFELHPEHAGTPYEVLLSQLGTFRYREKYGGR